MQIFFSHFEEAEFYVSSWKIARAASPTRALQTHDNGLQRAPVISYEELSGDQLSPAKVSNSRDYPEYRHNFHIKILTGNCNISCSSISSSKHQYFKVGDKSLKFHKSAYHLFSMFISKRGLPVIQRRTTFGENLSGNHRFLRPGIRLVTLHILSKIQNLMQQKYCLSNTKTVYN